MTYSALVVLGSDSDYPLMKPCLTMLSEFKIPFQVQICSAHRSPELARELAGSARDNGVAVIIAAAGLAAHLPGVLAAWTTVPVIGVPIATGPLAGQDALLAIVQMPPGVPVATVAINGAVNAALLAAQIIGIHDEAVNERLNDYKVSLKRSVHNKQQALDRLLEDNPPT